MFTFLLMIVAGGVAVYGLVQEKKGAEWGRSLAGVAAAVALVLALFKLFSGGGPDVEKIQKSQNVFRKIAGEKMGQYIAENFAGADVVAVGGIDFSGLPEKFAREYTGMEQSWEGYFDGFKKGIDDEVNLLDVVRLPVPEQARESIAAAAELAKSEGEDEQVYPEDTLLMPGIEDMYNPENYNKALKPYLKKADVIVVLTQLPYQVERLSLWDMASPPKLALMPGSRLYELKKAIAKGYIVGAITFKPGGDYRDLKVPGDLEEAFDKRYVLVTPDNVEAMSSEYKNLFSE